MGRDSAIEWTHHTFNPWRGCTKVSAGCAHCYADTQSKRNPGVLGIWGKDGSRVVAAESYWQQPLAWDKAAKAAGERHRVFCASMADVFESSDTMPLGHDGPIGNARARLFDLIERTPNLDWLLLTKRPQNIMPLVEEVYQKRLVRKSPWPLPNVWLGTSVEDQEAASMRIPSLLKVPAAVKFLSCEPLLGPVDLTQVEGLGFDQWDTLRGIVDVYGNANPEYSHPTHQEQCDRIDWVIVGGESGPKARPMDPDWVRRLRKQCKAAGVPFFFKQHGEWLRADASTPQPPATHTEYFGGKLYLRVGKNAAGRILDGRTWDEFPAGEAVSS